MVSVSIDVEYAGLLRKIGAMGRFDGVMARNHGLAVRDLAKAKAPVLTGELRESITLEVSGNTWTVFSQVRQAAPMEYGTYKDAAQPYLHPALAEVPVPKLIRISMAASGWG